LNLVVPQFTEMFRFLRGTRDSIDSDLSLGMDSHSMIPQHSIDPHGLLYLPSAPIGCCPLDGRGIRVLVAQESTSGFRIPLFDSNTSEPISLDGIPPKRRAGLSPHFDLLAQMMFGAMPLSNKSKTTKLHELRLPTCESSASELRSVILFTGLFSISLSDVEFVLSDPNVFPTNGQGNASADLNSIRNTMTWSPGVVQGPQTALSVVAIAQQLRARSGASTPVSWLGPPSESGTPSTSPSVSTAGLLPSGLDHRKQAARRITRSTYAVAVQFPCDCIRFRTFVLRHLAEWERWVARIQESVARSIREKFVEALVREVLGVSPSNALATAPAIPTGPPGLRRFLSSQLFGTSPSEITPLSATETITNITQPSQKASSSGLPGLGDTPAYGLQGSLMESISELRNQIISFYSCPRITAPLLAQVMSPLSPNSRRRDSSASFMSNTSKVSKLLPSCSWMMPPVSSFLSATITVFLHVTASQWVPPTLLLDEFSKMPSTRSWADQFQCNSRVIIVVVGTTFETAPWIALLSSFLSPTIIFPPAEKKELESVECPLPDSDLNLAGHCPVYISGFQLQAVANLDAKMWSRLSEDVTETHNCALVIDVPSQSLLAIPPPESSVLSAIPIESDAILSRTRKASSASLKSMRSFTSTRSLNFIERPEHANYVRLACRPAAHVTRALAELAGVATFADTESWLEAARDSLFWPVAHSAQTVVKLGLPDNMESNTLSSVLGCDVTDSPLIKACVPYVTVRSPVCFN
jgi:hypothetical protein